MKVLYFRYLRLISGMVLMACFSATSYGAQEAEDREFTLAGSAVSDDDFDSIYGARTSIGWFITKNFEWGLHQNVGLSDTEDETNLNGATHVFSDYHFDYAAWQPFIGASLGAIYSSGVDDEFVFGPEIGAKYYVMPKIFIVGQVSYQVNEDIVDDGIDGIE
ncbi:MAG: hypothetical protein ACREYC_28670, partial [Gammaproteobacteria bacterium]